ncbi:hypothetical protein MKW94_006287, partial [Papaver nudicaule]|nr:hypothetical protein [Papaver nudicaule]
FGENQTEDDCFDLFVVGDAEENRGGNKEDYFDLSEIGDPDTRENEGNQGEMDHKETGGRSKKNGKCNLRKSLAWDSAFFTND